MVFFLNFDPDLPAALRGQGIMVALIGPALGVSVVGLVGATITWVCRNQLLDQRRGADGKATLNVS